MDATPEVIDISTKLNALLTEFRQSMSASGIPPGPGVYPDMSMQDYLALPYVGASRLERLRRSPLQFRYASEPKEKKQDERELGSAVHLAILEPERFKDFYIVLGQCVGVTKKGDRCSNGGSIYRRGESWCGIHDPDKGAAADATVQVLSQDDFDSTLGMRDAVLSHPRARSLFEGKGDFEITMIFDDQETGVRCKIRPDRLIERAGMLVDVKTTYDAAPWSFPGQAERLGYWRKLALYRRGLRTLGWPYSSSTLLAIESAHPFDLVPYLCDEDDLNTAEREVESLLRTLRTCIEGDSWPGYADEFANLQRPAWAKAVNQ